MNANLSGFEALARSLTAKAARLAEARAAMRLRARRRDGSGWREARLLWPLFTTRN